MWPERLHPCCQVDCVFAHSLHSIITTCGLADIRVGSAAVGDASTLRTAALAVGSALTSPPSPHPVPLSFIAAVLTLRQLSVQFSEHLQRINHLSLLVGINQAFDLFDFCTSGNVEGLS